MVSCELKWLKRVCQNPVMRWRSVVDWCSDVDFVRHFPATSRLK
ncbi:hypothetical protein CIT292_08972 [Citrobacter youngae ATCC 29220]|uniref:Uncharacterized protein n=1 Tax=Citrobacter youngae ATCC 29220 TaxID=500640 RepID=D4BFF6_9ENTR|nr:hypothetical protein CIT292_08972 [Citrobacter youngae ATCC 29220]